MMIQHKWKSGFILLFSFLLVFTSCKKDKPEAPEVPFKIESYYPNSGNAGTLVTVEGEGFGTDIDAYRASVSGKEVEVISATSTSIVLRMPEGGATGNLSLSHDKQHFELGPYTYQELSVKTVFPANGPAGSQIRITGEGFSSTDGPAVVFINGKSALVVSVSDTQIVAEVPVDAGFGPVLIKVDGKEAKGQNFVYQAISSIKPLTGGKNTKVTINGVGFDELALGNVVDFNGTLATVLESSATKLLVLAPDGVKTGPLSVNINGQKTTGPSFTVVAAPAITVVSPLSGPKGTEMVISGTTFSPFLEENHVSLNGVPVPVTAVSATQLKLVIPGSTGSGPIRVVVNDQAVVGPQFKDQTLGILSVSPDNGLAGTTVTIRGSGFSTTEANNRVYFNGVPANVKTATENALVLDAPQGLSTGELKVIVGNQEALAPEHFRRAGVTTLAGGPNSNVFGGYLSGMDVDADGNVYVADRENRVVKKITPDGTISILKSNGADIIFNTPYGILIDKQNNIFVSDIGANQIRKITPSGQNSIYIAGFSPGLMSMDNSGNLYVNINGIFAGMNKVNTAGVATKIPGPLWPMARTVVDAEGNLYYVDSGSNSNNAVSLFTANGVHTSGWVGSSDPGYVDAVGLSARFNSISGGLALFGNGKIIAGDRYNYAIREIDIATKTASTLVKLTSGFADGPFSSAKIGSMDNIAVDKDGNIYILDAANRAIRKIFLK